MRDADNIEPCALLHQLRGCVPRVRSDREMVPLAAHQGSTSTGGAAPFLLYACLRVNGLMFLMPGLVSPQLPRAFAVPTAYGDLIASVLALLALAGLRYGSAAAMPVLWLFNVVGLLDLIYASISTFKDQVDPTYL